MPIIALPGQLRPLNFSINGITLKKIAKDYCGAPEGVRCIP
jgi:hypothetical protein